MPTSGEEPHDQTITLEKQASGRWTAIDDETGVASQGDTRIEALDNFDEALDAYYGRNTHTPNDDELWDIGIDPENNQPGMGVAPDWRE